MNHTDPQSRSAATALFMSWRGGDRAALDRLLPLVYDQLAIIAHGALSREREGHTLQTRALIHEAYLRLIDADVTYQDRSHFLAVAARTMRQVLVDHARSRRRDKRGGGVVHLDVSEVDVPAPSAAFDVLALHDAIDRLSAYDTRKGQLVELHFFGGLNQEEAATALGVSTRTVERELRSARALLRQDLQSLSS